MSMKLPLATISIRQVGRPRFDSERALSGEVRGLVFDSGDVLYDATVWRRWLLKLLTRLGLRTNYRSFYHIWDRDFLPDVYRGQREFREAFRAFLLSVGLSRGQIGELEVACHAQRHRWQAALRPLPGVQSTLGQLFEWGIPLAVIHDSELSQEAIQEQLHRLGLAPLVDTVVCSQTLGHVKPETTCYLAASEVLRLAPREVGFVGHDNEELAGAERAGMHTIAFNHDPEAKADVYLGRFEELLERIPAWRSHVAAG